MRPIGLDDPNGYTCGQYGITSFPSKLLIDRNGKILMNVQQGGDFLGSVRKAVLYGDRDD
jgi:hypothetical protein